MLMNNSNKVNYYGRIERIFEKLGFLGLFKGKLLYIVLIV